MTNNSQASKKKNAYIYTEADLGEGILDEGINPAYYAVDNQNTEPNTPGFNLAIPLPENKNNGLKIVNVEEDFNYAYYL